MIQYLIFAAMVAAVVAGVVGFFAIRTDLVERLMFAIFDFFDSRKQTESDRDEEEAVRVALEKANQCRREQEQQIAVQQEKAKKLSEQFEALSRDLQRLKASISRFERPPVNLSPDIYAVVMALRGNNIRITVHFNARVSTILHAESPNLTWKDQSALTLEVASFDDMPDGMEKTNTQVMLKAAGFSRKEDGVWIWHEKPQPVKLRSVN